MSHEMKQFNEMPIVLMCITRPAQWTNNSFHIHKINILPTKGIVFGLFQQQANILVDIVIEHI